MAREIEEKASNYMRGRAMALSFKPLSLQDIKEAYLCGAEDYAHISESINPWHKASEELPEETCACFVCWETIKHERKWTQIVMFRRDANNPEVGYFENDVDEVVYPDYWMYIPELPKKD